jgi:hypothetical protein
MSDCVVDASVLALANTDLATRRPGNPVDVRLRVVEQIATGARRLRYNQRLLGEYQRLILGYRNDLIELFFLVLDSNQSVLVPRSTLPRQHYSLAVRKCHWPSHDQHLLAAALGGVDPSIVVTEVRLANCGPLILRYFAVHLEQV